MSFTVALHNVQSKGGTTCSPAAYFTDSFVTARLATARTDTASLVQLALLQLALLQLAQSL